MLDVGLLTPAPVLKQETGHWYVVFWLGGYWPCTAALSLTFAGEQHPCCSVFPIDDLQHVFLLTLQCMWQCAVCLVNADTHSHGAGRGRLGC